MSTFIPTAELVRNYAQEAVDGRPYWDVYVEWLEDGFRVCRKVGGSCDRARAEALGQREVARRGAP